MKLKKFNEELKNLDSDNDLNAISIKNPDGVTTDIYPCECRDGNCQSIHITITNPEGLIEFKTWVYEDKDIPFVNRIFRREMGSTLGFIELHHYLQDVSKGVPDLIEHHNN